MYMWLCIYVRLCEQTERVGVGEVVGGYVMCVCVYNVRCYTVHVRQDMAHAFILTIPEPEILFLQLIYIRMFALHPPPHTSPMYLLCAIRRNGRIFLSPEDDTSAHTYDRCDTT